jgi:hypothetical protein
MLTDAEPIERTVWSGRVWKGSVLIYNQKNTQ